MSRDETAQFANAVSSLFGSCSSAILPLERRALPYPNAPCTLR